MRKFKLYYILNTFVKHIILLLKYNNELQTKRPQTKSVPTKIAAVQIGPKAAKTSMKRLW